MIELRKGALGSPLPGSPSLAPVAAALMSDAENDARVVKAAAAADAHDAVAGARAAGERQVESARAEGEASGARARSDLLAAARREALGLVLAAKRRAYEALREATVAELDRRRGSPEAKALLNRLATDARTVLGGDAEVLYDPDHLGVVVSANRRKVVITAPMLVDRELDSSEGGLERLWA
jgi:vacuolar-type H+-ATPase subunit E/Vma4